MDNELKNYTHTQTHTHTNDREEKDDNYEEGERNRREEPLQFRLPGQLHTQCFRHRGEHVADPRGHI